MKTVLIENRDGWGLDGVGETYRPENWQKLVGKTTLNQEQKQSVLVEVRSEPDNQYDKNAVALLVDGIHLGYLSSEDAKKYRPQTDRVAAEGATLLVSGDIWWVQRSDGLKANVRVNLPKKWEWDGETTEYEASPQVVAKHSRKAEWWTAAAATFVLLLIPYAGVVLAIAAIVTFSILITTGKFRYKR